MLPGIRFVIVTVMLSASVLIFGLGAAALLRASHEEFVSIPAWREAQKPIPQLPTISQTTETKPALAMLRIEPTVTVPAETPLPDPPKLASIAPDTVTEVAPADAVTTGVASIDAVKAAEAVTSQPVRQRARRNNRSRVNAALRRQRAIVRARAAQLRLQQQQQQQNADPFRLFPTPSTNGG